MFPIRTIAKNTTLGVIVALAALFLFITFVPFKYWPNWPIPKCTTYSTVSQVASPSKAVVARYVRTDCYSMGNLEAAVLIGYADNSKQQLIFTAPAHFRDRSGVQQPVHLRIVWRSEDTLEVHYPDEVAPNRTVEVFRGDSLIVRVMSVSDKVTSNPTMERDARKSSARPSL